MEVDRMNEKLIKCCPYCDSSKIYQRKVNYERGKARLPKSKHPEQYVIPKYRCHKCKQDFDIPLTRPLKSSRNDCRIPAMKILADRLNAVLTG